MARAPPEELTGGRVDIAGSQRGDPAGGEYRQTIGPQLGLDQAVGEDLWAAAKVWISRSHLRVKSSEGAGLGRQGETPQREQGDEKYFSALEIQRNSAGLIYYCRRGHVVRVICGRFHGLLNGICLLNERT
jgi:hypothetical protein